jgi:hypothetical protein
MRKIFGFLFLAVVWMACDNNNEQMSRLEIRLTDAPGDYEEVNIDIQGVEIHTTDTSSNAAWKSLDINKGVYDLLKLTNGLDTLLGSVDLPAGRVSQIRLILGSNNTVKENGEVKSIKTPSAQHSGLKLNLQADLKPGITYTITLDFDAARSIVRKGNGGFNLKPVIRAMEKATAGAIKGVVTPIEANPAIYAIAGTDTVATTFPDDTGKFFMRGIPDGMYTVTFEPKEGYLSQKKDSVSVTIGSVTDIGTITIEK